MWSPSKTIYFDNKKGQLKTLGQSVCYNRLHHIQHDFMFKKAIGV